MNDNVIEPNPAPYDPDEYIVTATLVKVSRNNVFCGTQNIHLAGKVGFLLALLDMSCP